MDVPPVGGRVSVTDTEEKSHSDLKEARLGRIDQVSPAGTSVLTQLVWLRSFEQHQIRGPWP